MLEDLPNLARPTRSNFEFEMRDLTFGDAEWDETHDLIMPLPPAQLKATNRESDG